MNLGQMRADVLRRLEEAQGSSVRWSASDVDAALNEGLAELSDATEFYEGNAWLTLRQYAPYYDLRAIIPDTILRVTAIFNPSNNLWLKPTDVRDLDYKTARQWEIVTGEPQRYFVRGLWWLGLYPSGPSQQGVVHIYYKAVHPVLLDTADSPQQLPEDYHTNIVDYAVYTLLADDVEVTQAMQYWNRYKQAEEELSVTCAPGGKLKQARIGGMGFRK